MARAGVVALARALLATGIVAAVAAGPLELGAGPLLAPGAARAAEDEWFAEFEDVCSRTQDAMSLSTDDLRALLARCDRLKPRVEALDPSRRKVYLKRLQLCRDLYRFVLDSRDRS